MSTATTSANEPKDIFLSQARITVVSEMLNEDFGTNTDKYYATKHFGAQFLADSPATLDTQEHSKQ